jgi:hypothetical protein
MERSKKDEMGQVALMKGKRDACKMLVEASEGKMPRDRRMHRWKGNVKMDLKIIRCEGADCELFKWLKIG